MQLVDQVQVEEGREEEVRICNFCLFLNYYHARHCIVMSGYALSFHIILLRTLIFFPR